MGGYLEYIGVYSVAFFNVLYPKEQNVFSQGGKLTLVSEKVSKFKHFYFYMVHLHWLWSYESLKFLYFYCFLCFLTKKANHNIKIMDKQNFASLQFLKDMVLIQNLLI